MIIKESFKTNEASYILFPAERCSCLLSSLANKDKNGLVVVNIDPRSNPPESADGQKLLVMGGYLW